MRIGARTELDDVLTWIEREAHRDLTLRDIATFAAVSVRTLNRRFQAETGQTPMQWVTGVRVRHAQQLLESTSHGVERIGREVGFTSPANFREQFRRRDRRRSAELPQHLSRAGCRLAARRYVLGLL